MDQLGRGRRSRFRQIALFGQANAHAAPRGVARNAGAVDTAADHQQIDLAPIYLTGIACLWEMPIHSGSLRWGMVVRVSET